MLTLPIVKWYETTPVNPPAGYPAQFPRFGEITGGSITVYGQAFDVKTSASAPQGDLQTGTSFAAPQAVS
jgi:hypothetical protein